MPRLAVEPDVRPLSDMAHDGDRVVREAIASGKATFLMDEGEAVAVLVSAARYEELRDTANRLDLIAALEAAEASAVAGNTKPNHEVVAWIRSWAPDDA